ncbi:MAG: DUF192 domain-containing protein [Eikenella sp.]|nr:DUF192 domain-containing protein [Eikenella sp.]
MRRRFPIPAAALAVCLSAAASAEPLPQLHLPRATLMLNGHAAEVQIAADEASQNTGLMYRRRMPADEGMLFVFGQTAVQCLWMRHTHLPLSAAFIREDGRIVSLHDMAPRTTRIHCSPEPVRYALEMHRGWFAAHGIGAGHAVQDLPAFR